MQDDPHQIWVNAIRHVCQDLTTLRKLIENWLDEYDWAEVNCYMPFAYSKMPFMKSDFIRVTIVYIQH